MYLANEEAKEELMHFGVKGMKWGVRKAGKKAKQALKTWKEVSISPRGKEAAERRKKIFNSLSPEEQKKNVVSKILNGSAYSNSILEGVGRGMTYKQAQSKTRKIAIGNSIAVGTLYAVGGYYWYKKFLG